MSSKLDMFDPHCLSVCLQVFEQARAGAPCILFIDEIDSVVGRRGTGQRGKGVQERVLSTLLNEMDGIGIRVEDLKRSSTNPQQKVAEGCADVASSEHVSYAFYSSSKGLQLQVLGK